MRAAAGYSGFAALLFASAVFAAQAPVAPEPIYHPPATSPEAEGELAPEITITERGETTVEEYRLHGQLYMIKVVPKKGVPYYLVDSDGDGDMERRVNELTPRLLIPSWVLLRWR